MWRVIALDKDGREVARADLASGELTVGRDQDRQMQLASASVSRRHAKLVVSGTQLLVVDDGSANGVVVNGARIGGPTPVDPRARVELADFRLVIESQSPQSQSPPSPQSAPPEATPSVAPFATAAGAVESLRLVAQGGPYDGRIFPLVGELLVGRAAENQLVLDDPSLSRKHARLRGTGRRMEVEDLGSSNGTFVNGRKVGSATAGPGDSIRFGELAFRIEDERGMGRPAGAMTGGLWFGLLAGGAATLVILITALVMLVRKPALVQASSKDAIAKIARQAEQHLKLGKQLFGDKKWADAKTELDSAIELDPANVEARRLRALAARAPEDERNVTNALAALAIGDRKALETALRLNDELSPGAPAKAQLEPKLSGRLIQYGVQRFDERDYADAAWALCQAFEVDGNAARADARVTRELHEAEKRLPRGSQSCRAAR
jgi:pSer/pThr/pTyr-binding forkhead associated (FHA) protein